MERDKYVDISFILRSPLRLEILECLEKSEDPLAPKQIAEKVGMARSNVSTKLKGLREKNFIECVNPDDRKWRFYALTDHGKKILKEVKKMKK